MASWLAVYDTFFSIFECSEWISYFAQASKNLPEFTGMHECTSILPATAQVRNKINNGMILHSCYALGPYIISLYYGFGTEWHAKLKMKSIFIMINKDKDI